jgi:prolyl oligopeptidase PreP (S9A serine peptidase family)
MLHDTLESSPRSHSTLHDVLETCVVVVESTTVDDLVHPAYAQIAKCKLREYELGIIYTTSARSGHLSYC